MHVREREVKGKVGAGLEEHTMVRSLVIGKVEIQHQVILIQFGRAKIIQKILKEEKKERGKSECLSISYPYRV